MNKLFFHLCLSFIICSFGSWNINANFDGNSTTSEGTQASPGVATTVTTPTTHEKTVTNTTAVVQNTISSTTTSSASSSPPTSSISVNSSTPSIIPTTNSSQEPSANSSTTGSTSTQATPATTPVNSSTTLSTSTPVITPNSSISSLTTSVNTSATSFTTTTSHLNTSTATQSLPGSSTTPPVASTTPSPPTHNVNISETNILLVKAGQSDRLFIELSGQPDGSLDGIFLTIRNASVKDDKDGVLECLKLTGKFDEQGIFVVDKAFNLNLHGLVDLRSVVVALYSDDSSAKNMTEQSLLDSLVFSISPDEVDPEVAEVYHPVIGNDVIVNTDVLGLAQDVSLSRCNDDISGFVLTTATRNKPNHCDIKLMQAMKLKLSHQVEKNKCPSIELPSQFNELVVRQIVTEVNKNRTCGLTSYNIRGMITETHCKDDSKEIAIKFHVKYVFEKQIYCITTGFHNFVHDKATLRISGQNYFVANCSNLCFPSVLPPSKNAGSDIKVTVAVVVSCIGVFLVILVIVIVYMKRKRRGILQFRMTRLDEEDDDLVGDMDDFVGNQGATFSNMR